MNAASLSSARLQRFLACLYDGGWKSTRQIIQETGLCAINSCAAECRENGLDVPCEQRGRVFYYRWARVPVQLELAA